MCLVETGLNLSVSLQWDNPICFICWSQLSFVPKLLFSNLYPTSNLIPSSRMLQMQYRSLVQSILLDLELCLPLLQRKSLSEIKSIDPGPQTQAAGDKEPCSGATDLWVRAAESTGNTATLRREWQTSPSNIRTVLSWNNTHSVNGVTVGSYSHSMFIHRNPVLPIQIIKKIQ